MAQRGIDHPNFRLRKKKDADLRAALEQLDEDVDIADVIRAALRLYFGLGNKPQNTTQDKKAVVLGSSTDNIKLVKLEKSDDEILGAFDDLLDKF